MISDLELTHHSIAPMMRKISTTASLRCIKPWEVCTFSHMISLGSGATSTSRAFGLWVKGEEDAFVTVVWSKNVTKPVEDIVLQLSTTTSSKNSQRMGKRCVYEKISSNIATFQKAPPSTSGH